MSIAMPVGFLERAASIVGAANVLREAHDKAGYETDWRGRYRGQALAVVRPRTTDEVADVVRLCAESRVPIVPQAGNTGLVGGAVPSADGSAIILNVERMNAIRAIDPANNSMTVDAGAILADVRAAAEQHDRYFPMFIGSVGSCRVGGLVSTNAGGTGVLRYGNMRELTLGLEAVLPDGRIWNGLKALRKDNTGYDLKQLLIGAEGTLGIVTAATLKLFPRLTRSTTAMVALAGVADAIDLLRRLQATVGNRIEAFEIMSKTQLEIVVAHGPGVVRPNVTDAPWYVLIELADSDPDWDANAQLQRALEAAVESSLVLDAIFATDIAKAERIWALRHNVSEANKTFGFTISNDTSVPVSALPTFIAAVDARLSGTVTGCTVCHVGHIGDGNIHVVVLLSRDVYTTSEARTAAASHVNAIVHEESVQLGGSISAEHGIGQMHVAPLQRFTPALDLEIMRGIKKLLDPMNLMNPGKLFQTG